MVPGYRGKIVRNGEREGERDRQEKGKVMRKAGGRARNLAALRVSSRPYLLEVGGEEGNVVLSEGRALVEEAGIEDVQGQVVLLLLGVGGVGGHGKGQAIAVQGIGVWQGGREGGTEG